MKTKLALIGLAALFLAALLVAADEAKTERFVVPFSNPSKPGRIEVSMMLGNMKVIGYEGQDVIIEATKGEMTAFIGRGAEEPEAKKEEEDAESQAAKTKAAGMKRIPLESAGLEIEEENNVIEVNVESWRRPMDLVIRVPFNTSLELESMGRGGGITVENVSGEIEVDNIDGPVTLSSVSGSVTANTTNGDVKVGLVKVTPNKPMAFSTLRGDLDVTFPADIKANVRIETQRGELFSDFDISLKQMPQKAAESSKKEGGKFRISLDSAYYGTINGGGPEFQFENFQGNIYLRKKK